MEVPKTPAPGASAIATAGAAPASPSKTAPGQVSPAAADRADIRPLDVQAALQILLAEVRAAFDLQAIALGGEGSIVRDDTSQAARAVIDTALQDMPDAAAPPADWSAAITRADAALSMGLARGLEAVSGWREVSAPVVEAAQAVRSLALSIFIDEQPNSIWLRPEWLGLAPRFEAMRRRRLRKGLSDPDYSQRRSHDSDEQR